MADRFQHKLEKFVGVEKPPTLAMSGFQTGEFTATRVRWEQTQAGHPVQFERAEGYMVCLQRQPIPAQPYWADQRPMPLQPMSAGQFLLLDLQVEHSSLVPSGVDCISVFTSRETLLEYQAEHDLAQTGLLHAPIGAIHQDSVIRHLGEALMPAIDQPQVATQLYADHVALALLSRLCGRFGTDPPRVSPMPAGLAPWQERRAKQMLLAHLDGTIGLEALASECRLSRSHFARAFKATTGDSPLRWLQARRLEQAKALLLNTALPLEQVAASSGFSDASHLARCFARVTGLPPGTWRRLHRR